MIKSTKESLRMDKEGLFSGIEGEMAELTNRFNWSATSLGPPSGWPYSLVSTVSLILSSRFPMFLWWGDDLIQFYNDAYRPSLGNDGKHPFALGQKGKECWPEIWDIIYPLIGQVLTTGKPTWSEDQLVPIYRNGKIEDVYWTFGYSAARNDAGKIEGVLVVCTETTNRVKIERNLRNTILQAPVAMCIFRGLEYVVEIANDRMLEFWGITAKEALYKPIFEMLPDAKNQGFEDLLYGVYTTGQTFSAYDVSIDLRRNGQLEKVYFNLLYEAYREANGAITGIIAVVLEVTDQVLARQKIEEIVTERTKELAAANKYLQRSNAELAQFAYIASHDLQEPVRKVSVFGQLLESSLDNINAQSRGYLNKINKSTARMQTLIRDVLTFSQLSKENPEFEPVDLQQTVDGIVSDFELLLDQKKAKLIISPLPTIQAISLQMSQLFGNLLSNSLKFARTDRQPVISINATLLTEVEAVAYGLSGADYYDIEFKDNGIGFKQSNAEQIFHIFQRLHRKNEYEGTGIGLALCKRIMDNHQGLILAKGDPESGAIFHVILPATQVA